MNGAEEGASELPPGAGGEDMKPKRDQIRLDKGSLLVHNWIMENERGHDMSRKFWDVAFERAEAVVDAKDLVAGLIDNESDSKESDRKLDSLWDALDVHAKRIGEVLDLPKSRVRRLDLKGI